MAFDGHQRSHEKLCPKIRFVEDVCQENEFTFNHVFCTRLADYSCICVLCAVTKVTVCL